MAIDLHFRKQAVGTLTRQIGVYALCDLDNVPLYVGQSTDGIRQRVQRHLTSARSDIIANRQIDIWEVAFVWEYPVNMKEELADLEAALFHAFNPNSQLMNGAIPSPPPQKYSIPGPNRKVQVMESEEIEEKKDVELRLPRQATRSGPRFLDSSLRSYFPRHQAASGKLMDS